MDKEDVNNEILKYYSGLKKKDICHLQQCEWNLEGITLSEISQRTLFSFIYEI